MTDTPTATPSQLNLSSRIAAGLLGHLAGDALGVPVQFKPRSDRRADPVDGMHGYGTNNQPPGTWSDDGSLTLCTAEALLDGFDLQRVANNFVRWLDQGYGRGDGGYPPPFPSQLPSPPLLRYNPPL